MGGSCPRLPSNKLSSFLFFSLHFNFLRCSWLIIRSVLVVHWTVHQTAFIVLFCGRWQLFLLLFDIHQALQPLFHCSLCLTLSSSSFPGFCYRRGIGRPISRPLRILNSILYFLRFFQISQYAKVNARLFKCKDLTKQKKERNGENSSGMRGGERKDLFSVFVHYSPDFLICFSFLFPLYLFWKIKKDYPSTLFLDLNGYFIDLNYSTWTFELSNLSLKLFFPASLTSFFLLPFLTSLTFPFVFDFLFYSLNSIFKTLWLTDLPFVFPFIYPVPVSRYPLCFSALLFTSFLLCLFHCLRSFFLSHFFLLPSFVFFFLSLVL